MKLTRIYKPKLYSTFPKTVKNAGKSIENKRCNAVDCDKEAKTTDGFCCAHGKKENVIRRRCTHPDCADDPKFALSGSDFCQKHGGKPRMCAYDRCEMVASYRWRGYCSSHGKEVGVDPIPPNKCLHCHDNVSRRDGQLCDDCYEDQLQTKKPVKKPDANTKYVVQDDL